MRTKKIHISNLTVLGKVIAKDGDLTYKAASFWNDGKSWLNIAEYRRGKAAMLVCWRLKSKGLDKGRKPERVGPMIMVEMDQQDIKETTEVIDRLLNQIIF